MVDGVVFELRPAAGFEISGVELFNSGIKVCVCVCVFVYCKELLLLLLPNLRMLNEAGYD